MADSYVQGSIAFSCTHAELALIEEVFEASYAFMAEDTPADPSPEFLAAFPPVKPEDPWSGFLAIFADPDFPDFGVEFEAENPRDRPELSTVFLYSTTDFQPGARTIARFRARSHGRVVRARADEGVASLCDRRGGGARGGVRRG